MIDFDRFIMFWWLFCLSCWHLLFGLFSTTLELSAVVSINQIMLVEIITCYFLSVLCTITFGILCFSSWVEGFFAVASRSSVCIIVCNIAALLLLMCPICSWTCIYSTTNYTATIHSAQPTPSSTVSGKFPNVLQWVGKWLGNGGGIYLHLCQTNQVNSKFVEPLSAQFYRHFGGFLLFLFLGLCLFDSGTCLWLCA